MEGDVLSGLMRWQVAMWVVGLAVGALVLVARAFGHRLMREIDARFDRIDALSREVARVDGDLKCLIAELPIHYQRREDAIREYTSVNAKLDRIWWALIEVRNGTR